jgi:hypothetical protein
VKLLIDFGSYIGSLFSIKGPRDTTALLDIERALNKLEKVALQRRSKGDPPLILIIGSTHLIRDDDDGRNLLEMMQQRAEQWAASDLVTMSRLTTPPTVRTWTDSVT